jgi:Domain of unknown function (DUF4352)
VSEQDPAPKPDWLSPAPPPPDWLPPAPPPAWQAPQPPPAWQAPQPPPAWQAPQPPPAWQPPPPQPPQKRMRRWVPWAITAAAAVLVAGIVVAVVAGTNTDDGKTHAAAPTSKSPAPMTSATETQPTFDETTSAPPEEAPTLAVGERADITQDGADAATITVTKVTNAATEPGEFGMPPEHGRYLIITVTATGVGAPFDVNALDFYVTGRDGSHYEDSTFSDARGAPFESGTLHNGEHLTGTIVYDVSPAAIHGQFGYTPNYDSVPVVVWAY